MAALWSNQIQPRKSALDCAECALSASRGSNKNATSALQATASNKVIKLINWNQCRVAEVLQRVHTDCFGRKFRPQRSQNNLALPRCWNGVPHSHSDYRECLAQNYWSEVQRNLRPVSLPLPRFQIPSRPN